MTIADRDAPITDEELEALALAADPDAGLADDAVPWQPDGRAPALVADWYMPAPAGLRRDWRARVVAGVLVASIVAINAAGLCVTYGRVAFG